MGNLSKHIDYSAPFLYENDTLKTIFTSAGRIVPKDNNGEVLYKFEYNLQDHLGNTRVVFAGNDNGKPELLQLTDYYPFGMTMKQENYFANDVLANKYLYNGKELQNDEVAGSKLDWYDYGARMYDPALGRFHTQDRYADEFSSWSPYHYALNNPISYIDINGDSTYTFNIATSALQMVSDVGGNEQQIVNFVNKDGSALIVNDKAVSSIVDGEEVHVTPTSKGTLVSSYDPLAGLSDDYNSNSGYEYTAADLKTRHKLKGTSLEYGVAAREAGGNASPIAGKPAYDAYVKKWGTDKAFMYGIEGGYFSNMLPGGTTDILSGAQRALSSGSRNIRTFSPNFSKVKSPIKSSWGRYQHANKGSGKSVQQMAKEYNRLMKGK